jgi:hypothetical protein
MFQNGCKETFCLFPYENSIFHWTDGSKPKELKIRCDEYSTSGGFKIDTIGETFIKLKNLADNSLMIIKVVILEIESTYVIEFSDGSYIPPYRIENMTRNNIVVSQPKSRAEEANKHVR